MRTTSMFWSRMSRYGTGLAATIASVLVVATSLTGEPENIVTIAGSGPYVGDGDGATNANLNLPEGVATDAAGNLYIADANNNRIRKVDAGTGTVSTFAGNGLVGFSGDGGPATDARLNSPSDLGFDSAGNLYFTDAGNERLRRVESATGLITTVAGTGIAGYSGDGGPAVAALLNSPRGIAIVSEIGGPSIYIADLRNNVVRKIDGTGIVMTVAGTGVAENSLDGGLATATPLNTPFGLAADTGGNLFVGEGGVGAGSHRIRRVDATTNIITTVAGIAGSAGTSPDGTLATAATINSPRDIAFDSAGILYFVENGNHRVRVINRSGVAASIFGSLVAPETIATIAGTGVVGFSGDGGPGTAARLSGPFFITLDGAGNLYIGDRGNSRVRRVDRTTGFITTVAGGFTPPSDDGGGATSAYLSNPAGVALDALGNLYVAENGANRVRTVDATTGIITTVAGMGSAGSSGDGGPATAARLAAPQGIAIDRLGNLYVAESSRVRKVDGGSGMITTVAGTGVAGSSGDGGPATLATFGSFRVIALDAADNLWIADLTNHRIRFVNLSQNTVTVADQIVAPGNIARIVGTLQGSSGDGGSASAARINLPLGLAFDPAGNLYFSQADHRIRFVNLSDDAVIIHGQTVGRHNIATIIGTGLPGFSGDGSAATAARLFGPQGLAIDGARNIYIADTNNDRIRKVDTTGIITTVVGIGAPGFSGDGGSATVAAINNPRFLASTQPAIFMSPSLAAIGSGGSTWLRRKYRSFGTGMASRRASSFMRVAKCPTFMALLSRRSARAPVSFHRHFRAPIWARIPPTRRTRASASSASASSPLCSQERPFGWSAALRPIRAGCPGMRCTRLPGTIRQKSSTARRSPRPNSTPPQRFRGRLSIRSPLAAFQPLGLCSLPARDKCSSRGLFPTMERSGRRLPRP